MKFIIYIYKQNSRHLDLDIGVVDRISSMVVLWGALWIGDRFVEIVYQKLKNYEIEIERNTKFAKEIQNFYRSNVERSVFQNYEDV